MQLADMICGNSGDDGKCFLYRSSSRLTEFFEDCGTSYAHDGSTRNYWVAEILEKILAEPHADATTPPDSFLRVIRSLLDPADAIEGDEDRAHALARVNLALAREGYQVIVGSDGLYYLKHLPTNTVTAQGPNPHRPFTAAEVEKRAQLSTYLDQASEDELIENILLPLFRQLGFHRITSAGHKDKALEYGKDIWMKYKLPTQHVIYFGIQVKKDKLDAAGLSKAGNANVGEVLNQTTMMLGHEIFDPEIGKRVLVDHVFIVAGGEITKAARNWLGGKLDASERSQVMFMDRNDILDLFVVTNLPLPNEALPDDSSDDDTIPF